MRYWPQKPSLGVPINWGDPLARGLVACWLMNEGGGSIKDISQNYPSLSIPSGWIWLPGKSGPALQGNASGYITTPGCLVKNYPFTLVSLVRSTVRADVTSVLLSIGDTSTWGKFHQISLLTYAAGGLQFGSWSYVGNATSDSLNIDKAPTMLDEYGFHLLAYVFESSASKKLYLNGILETTGTVNQPFDSSTNAVRIGARASSENSSPLASTHQLGYSLLYNRALSASEVLQLYITRFRMFQEGF